MLPEVELSGSDYFLFAMDRIMCRAGRSSSLCRLVVELEGRIDPEEFRHTINCSQVLQWMVNVRKTKKLPFALPRWRSNGSGNTVPVACISGEEGSSCRREGFLSFSRLPWQDESNPPLSFVLASHDDHRSTCMLNWDHTLMDAHGAEILMRHVARPPGEQECLKGMLLSNQQNKGGRAQPWRKFSERLSYARKSIHYIAEASAMPIAILQPKGCSRDSADQYCTISFSKAETERIVSQCETIGLSYCHSLFYLAAATRALHAVRLRNMDGARPYLVPVPLNLRRKGDSGPAFSNNVSFLFYRITPGEIGDLRKTAASLKEQMRSQVMQEIPHSYAEMMKILRRLPLPLYSRLLSGPTRGRLASFFFSYTGECCSGMENFMGHPVRQVTHFAPATSIPGLSVVFMRHRNRLKAILSFRDSLLAEDDLKLFEEQLRQDLLPEHG